ncbi:prepilin peptidase-dependent protein [Enterobacter hormaechei]|uniref:prepilin peptidase-dependent protein n=1 Tax=Enterobacter hormaechei TaxID=158836 RepID=UPI0028EBCEFB|nr:prepilin peptidase-dependent protein [Enterobacter hormaechei]WNS24317.1 prepilin peptidase-dependent protein [Enterobacter hormaechei]
MPVNRKGFSLLEVLIAMTISSILLLSTSRFLPGLQRGVLLQSGQQELEDEVWQRLFAIGKQFQRAGYCAGHCQGQGMIIGRQGRCAIVLWDANSNGQWDSTASENDSTGFRLESGSLETLRGATSCDDKGWDKLTDPDQVLIEQFMVTKTDRDGFAPVISIELRARRKGGLAAPFSARHTVTGFNL